MDRWSRAGLFISLTVSLLVFTIRKHCAAWYEYVNKGLIAHVWEYCLTELRSDELVYGSGAVVILNALTRSKDATIARWFNSVNLHPTESEDVTWHNEEAMPKVMLERRGSCCTWTVSLPYQPTLPARDPSECGDIWKIGARCRAWAGGTVLSSVKTSRHTD